MMHNRLFPLFLALAPFAFPAAQAETPAPMTTAVPAHVLVHKTPTCGCCVAWVEHMRQSGFEVEVRDHDYGALDALKRRLGVPAGKGSCHTAEVGGYFVEGHVPAADVQRLLAERPAARGLTVPGMPAGSPGMEMPDGRVQPYAVELITKGGDSEVFARHGR